MHPFPYHLEQAAVGPNLSVHGLLLRAVLLAVFALTVARPCSAQPAPAQPAPAEPAAAPPASPPPDGPAPSSRVAEAGPASSPPEPPTENPAAACAQKHEAAQVERMADRLLEAREALLACAREECPSVVRVDCARWLDEVRAEIPTVVFEALGDEGLVTDVVVTMGEQTLTTSLDGKPIEVPVGLSEFTFTRRSGERKAFRVLLRQGETNRIVSADFRTHDPALNAAPTTAPPAPMMEIRPVPTSVWLLGTAALVATVTGATLGIVAKVKEGDASAACAPACTDGVVSEIEDIALAADISFGVAIIAGVTATILYLGRPTVRVPRTETAEARKPHAVFAVPRVVATTHGAWLGLEGRFQ